MSLKVRIGFLCFHSFLALLMMSLLATAIAEYVHSHSKYLFLNFTADTCLIVWNLWVAIRWHLQTILATRISKTLFDCAVGYKLVGLHPDGSIFSHANNETWVPYETFKAKCRISTYLLDHDPRGKEKMIHTPPNMSCACGVYATRNLNELLPPEIRGTFADDNWFLLDFADHAVCKVALWGKVIECKNGFRAEYAYPLAISSAKAAQYYGVPTLKEVMLANEEI